MSDISSDFRGPSTCTWASSRGRPSTRRMGRRLWRGGRSLLAVPGPAGPRMTSPRSRGIIPAMSATLLARGLAAGHGARTLFSGLDLVVAPGDVIGLVGVNGAGKSTLLRLLAGLDTPQDGTVRRSPADAGVGYLPQEVERRTGETVLEYVHRRTGVADAQRALDAAAEALAAGPNNHAPDNHAPDNHQANDYPAALDHWLALGAAD